MGAALPTARHGTMVSGGEKDGTLGEKMVKKNNPYTKKFESITRNELFAKVTFLQLIELNKIKNAFVE